MLIFLPRKDILMSPQEDAMLMNEESRRILASLPAGRALDLCCGSGDFIQDLIVAGPDFSQIVGVDLSDVHLGDARKRFQGDSRIVLEVGAVSHKALGAEGPFSVISIAKSLHHVPEPHLVLARAARELVSGGRIVVYEQRRDGLTADEAVHTRWHDVLGEVERRLGFFHVPTFTGEAMLDVVDKAGLQVEAQAEVLQEAEDFSRNEKAAAMLRDAMERLRAQSGHSVPEHLETDVEGVLSLLRVGPMRKARCLLFCLRVPERGSSSGAKPFAIP